jgi:hypothetical protein
MRDDDSSVVDHIMDEVNRVYSDCPQEVRVVLFIA